MKKQLLALALVTAFGGSDALAQIPYYPALSNDEQTAFDALKGNEDIVLPTWHAVNQNGEDQVLGKVEAQALGNLVYWATDPHKVWDENKSMNILGNLIKKRRLFVRLDRGSL